MQNRQNPTILLDNECRIYPSLDQHGVSFSFLFFSYIKYSHEAN
jgi:hypothetical protein